MSSIKSSTEIVEARAMTRETSEGQPSTSSRDARSVLKRCEDVRERLDSALASAKALAGVPLERDAMTRSARACRFRVNRLRERLERGFEGGKKCVGAVVLEADDSMVKILDADAAVTEAPDVTDDDVGEVESREQETASYERTISFWRELEEDDSPSTALLLQLVRLALNGVPEGGAVSARELARRSRPTDIDEDAELSVSALYRSADDLITRASCANFGSGFLAGLGGLLSLPVTIPGQLAVTTFTSLRLAFAIAILAGRGPLDPATAARAIQAALGVDVTGDDDDDALSVKTASAKEGMMHAAIRGSGTALQGASWRLMRVAATKLAQRGVQRGASMAVTRAVPIIGGVIGGTVDGVLTRTVGARAVELFFPPRPSGVKPNGALGEHAEQAVANLKIAAESAASSLNGAFDSLSASFKKSFGSRRDNASSAGDTPTSVGYQSSELQDDSWERFERELELESMREILEDGYQSKRRDVVTPPASSPTKSDPAKDAERAAKRAEKDILWAEHEAEWKVFSEDHSDSTGPRKRLVRYRDVPWPPSTSRVLLGSAGRDATPVDVRDAYRRLILRWHPDRFARYALDSRDSSRINAKLAALASAIKDQYAAFQTSC